MRGGLAASWTKMRVAKPRVVTRSARIMGVKARWVTLTTQVLEDPFCLVPGVELVVLYGLLVGLFDLRLGEARPAPLLIELDAQRSVGQTLVGHHLPLIELEEVPARAPEVDRRQGGDDDQNDRQPPHELHETRPETTRPLAARGPGSPSGTALLGALAPGGREGSLARRPQGEHLAGAAGATLGPLSYVGLASGLLLYVDDDDGDVIVAAGLQ